MKSRSTGVTLVELMIVIVIVGLLGAIAIPSYNGYVLQGHRAQALVFIQNLAAKQEAYHNMNGSYGWLAHLDGVGLGVDERTYTTTQTDGTILLDDRYKITNSSPDPDVFWLELEAIGTQAEDDVCTYIYLDQDWTLDSGSAEERFCRTSKTGNR